MFGHVRSTGPGSRTGILHTLFSWMDFSPMEQRQEQALATLKSLLIDGEQIVHYAFQLRLPALVHRRVLVAATNMRLVIFSRRLIGGYRMVDIRWQDLRNAMIDENLLDRIFGAVFTVKAQSLPRPARVFGLQAQAARQVYVYSQQQEQEWRERNRIRSIEEERARSGGMYFTPNAGQTTTDPARHHEAAPDATQRLKKAKGMLDDGLITDSEYQAIKARIVNEL